MATGNMVPYSNPAGNNQTTPSAGVATPTATAQALPGATTTAATSSNPLVPAGTAVTSPTTANAAATTPAIGSTLSAQWNDIYGAEGTAMAGFLNSLNGTDSLEMQNYTKSLQPQEAKAQANTNAALGAGGVSANSSVTALADASLQSNEFSDIAREQNSLLQYQDTTIENMLQQTAPAAAQQVADDAALPWEMASAGLQILGGPGNQGGSMLSGMLGSLGKQDLANGNSVASAGAGSSGGSTMPDTTFSGMDSIGDV